MLSERRQSTRTIDLYDMSMIVKAVETESRLVIVWHWGVGVVGKWGMTSKGHRILFGGDENVPNCLG